MSGFPPWHNFQFHSFTCKSHNFSFLYNGRDYYLHVPCFHHLFLIWWTFRWFPFPSLLWIVWQLIWLMRKCLWNRMWSPSGKCRGIVQLGHIVDMLFDFWEFVAPFYLCLYHPTISPTVTEGSPFPCPHQCLLSVILLTLTILTVERWNIKVALICIILFIKDVEHI